jgi:hypothetical protein
MLQSRALTLYCFSCPHAILRYRDRKVCTQIRFCSCMDFLLTAIQEPRWSE